LKAPAFDYVRVRSLGEALALLEQHGDEAKIIAGGQSLVPALNLRLLAPRLLIDIGDVDELKGISINGDTVTIGALVRHVELERSPEIAAHAPLLKKAIAHVAHPAIRNRGTIGGNLAHADPASELPACAVALQACMIVATGKGERSIAAEEFFTGVYETALAPTEILTAIDVPAAGAGERFVFTELARRSGDYALVGLAARARVHDDAFTDLRLAYFAVGSKPTLAASAAAQLTCRPVGQAALLQAQAALSHDLEPQDDLHASAAMRLHLARVLLRRAVEELLPETHHVERKRA
jgi:aerobic carbon-monoxide dehydrogenase medium subunit